MIENIKKGLFAIAVVVWAIVLYKILTNNEDFATQAQSCILSTAAIFAVALMIIKAIEFKQNNDV